jgi:peptidoglycan-associated lipoprotein
MSGYRYAAGVLMVIALACGCARTPKMTAASSPSPTGGGTTDSRKGGPAGDRLQPASQRGGTSTSGASARPNPSEFSVASELKDVHFDFDKYDIRPADAALLDADAAWLKTNTFPVLLEGHCDERGTNEYNLALGERRAKATMNYLVAHGIAATRMTVVSYGEERPVCGEHSEACWAQNRRAHFLVKRN